MFILVIIVFTAHQNTLQDDFLNLFGAVLQYVVKLCSTIFSAYLRFHLLVAVFQHLFLGMLLKIAI